MHTNKQLVKNQNQTKLRRSLFGELSDRAIALFCEQKNTVIISVVNHLDKKEFMINRQPRYSKEEFAQRGNHLYETQIRPLVETGNYGKVVAIDIETGSFEMAKTAIAATDQLYSRYPYAQPWVIRIGHRTLYRFGSGSLKKSR